MQKSLKELNCLAPLAPPPLLQVNFKTRLNSCLRLNFLNHWLKGAKARLAIPLGCATEMQPKEIVGVL